MLNVFKMRSNLARMELSGGASLAEGKAQIHEIVRRVARAAAAGRSASTTTRTNGFMPSSGMASTSAAARTRRATNGSCRAPGRRRKPNRRSQDFEQYVRFMKAQPGVRFVTATELMQHLRRRARRRAAFDRDDLLALARCGAEGDLVSAIRRLRAFGRRRVQPADRRDDDVRRAQRTWPAAVEDHAACMGPSRAFSPPTGGGAASSFRWSAFARAVRDTADFCRSARPHCPTKCGSASESLSPADYLATLAAAIEEHHGLRARRRPTSCAGQGRFTADRYVADDSPRLWDWVIFPEGFHAPRIMELARLQAWTLKPAVFQR